ncbi:MAG: iron ABC transporter permease [SAR324 cluster bacterium]|nr:iron ABC transporter permease [SAR324 cluster bacterium]
MSETRLHPLHYHRPLGMTVAGAGISLLMVTPLLYIAWYALQAEGADWVRLWDTTIPQLLVNTVSLALATAAMTFGLGVSLAWLVTRYDFPGKRMWSWLLAMPLGIPPYIMAYAYTEMFLPGGWAQRAWQGLFGAEAALPMLYGHFPAVVWVLGLATFPYVYLLVRASLTNYNVAFEEVARIQGMPRWRRFFHVTLPLQRPAIMAGLFLVVLYVFSDFGAVSMMRFPTFTRAIYLELVGRSDRVSASVLALVLIAMSALLFWQERRARSRSRFYQTGGHYRRMEPVRCSWRGALAIWSYLLLVFGSAFGVVIALLIYRSVEGIELEGLPTALWEYTFNSLFASGMAATLSVFMIVPVAYLATRYRDRLYQVYLRASYAGYVLPGPIIGVGVLFISIHLLAPLYGTVSVVILAYLIRFLPQGLQAQETAFHQIKPNLEEAARTCGASFHRALLRVVFPLAKTGIATGWVLIFVSSMKELPATLLLRPLGFDTLAVRIWIETSEEFYSLAAPAALVLIAVTAPLFGLLIFRDARPAAS